MDIYDIFAITNDPKFPNNYYFASVGINANHLLGSIAKEYHYSIMIQHRASGYIVWHGSTDPERTSEAVVKIVLARTPKGITQNKVENH